VVKEIKTLSLADAFGITQEEFETINNEIHTIIKQSESLDDLLKLYGYNKSGKDNARLFIIGMIAENNRQKVIDKINLVKLLEDQYPDIKELLGDNK